MNKKLYRSQTDKMLGGVCGGLGNYLTLDPVFVRIFFIILVMADGIGFFIYLLLWIIMPREDQVGENGNGVSFDADHIADKARGMGDELQQAVRKPHPDVFKFVGLSLIAMGIFAVLNNLDIRWLRWFDADLLWPLLLIIGGGYLVWRTIKKDE